MEWVETTGRSVEEAKEAALDELGVDEADAEFEVVAEAQTGLFGRLRNEARVRARVRPTAPRSKDDRRDRKRRNGRGSSSDSTERPAASGETTDTPRPAKAARPRGERAATRTSGETSAAGRDETSPEQVESEQVGSPPAKPERTNGNRGNSRSSSRNGAGLNDQAQPKGAEVEVALDQQAAIAVQFLTELTAEFGLEAKVDITNPDEDTAELQLTGSDLGLLIGPKGATLVAVQNLARTVVFHETGATNGYINVDVGGYRHKRTEALIRFAQQVAAKVQETGVRTPLEPMSAVDRKVVHDAIGDIDGVSTTSEGEEPNRRVVVLPATSDH